MGFYIFNSKLHFRYTITTISVIPDKDGQLAVFFRSSLLADLKYIRLGKGNWIFNLIALGYGKRFPLALSISTTMRIGIEDEDVALGWTGGQVARWPP